MKPAVTRGLLGLGLAAVLLAAWFAPEPSGDGVEPAERTRALAARTAGAAAAASAPARAAGSRNPEVLRIRPREATDDVEASVFTPARWDTPAAPVAAAPAVNAAPEAPPPAEAPPLPFRFIGRYADGGEVAVFLQYNDQSLVVRVGDTVAENYKAVSLQSGTLTLLYTPLNQKQTLDVGESETRDTP